MRVDFMPKQLFAIGDIHGCAEELRALLRKLPLTSESWIVFLGDYIDRGPNSKDVVDAIIEISQLYRTVPLRGNHEAMLLDFLDHPDSEEGGLFIMNGGSTTLANYSATDGSYGIPPKHLEFFRNLQLSFETPDYFFVHAGLPDVPIRELNPKNHSFDMLWIRQPFLESTYNWGKMIVHGHTPKWEVEQTQNRINLDTACVFDGVLTAMEVNTRKTYCVRRRAPGVRAPVLRDAGSIRTAIRFNGSLQVRLTRAGGQMIFMTENYSEFGLLLKHVSAVQCMVVDDKIEGQIGTSNKQQVGFKGTVVRVQRQDKMYSYAIRLDSLERSIDFKPS
jgi:serine/threonine protein phosphatase 1